MNPQAKIYVAGHRGMVGSAIVRGGRLNALGWRAKVNLEQGLSVAYKDFLNSGNALRTQ